MKTKTLTLLFTSILALVFLVGLASAATTYTETFDNSSATGTYDDNSFLGDNGVTWTFINSKDAESYSITGESLQFEDTTSKITSNAISGGMGTFSVKLKKATTISGDRQVELYINGALEGTSTEFDDDSVYTFTIDNINVGGDFTIEIRNIQDAQVVIDDITWTAYTEELDVCSYDGGVSQNPGELKVEIKDISVVEGYGNDEEWLPLDEVEVEIKVKNKGDYDVDDISLEWGIVDDELSDWVVELDEIDEFNLKDGDEDTFTITFRIDEDDLDMDLEDIVGNDYNLVVRATGVIDDSASPDDEEETCAGAYEKVSIESESDFVIVNNIELENALDTVSCGTQVQITADVWNIGDKDQDDVSVYIYNKDLGIDDTIKIGDINSFDNEPLSFEFQIPEGMEEKWYTLEFEVYDEDDDIYENDYDDEKSAEDFSIKVEGNCVVPEAAVTASLESGGKAGQPLVVRATITNSGTESTTYTVSASGYETWASSANVEPGTLILEPQASKDVLFTLKANKDAEGSNIFNIDIYSEGEFVESQPVSVSIEKSLLARNELTTALIIGISVILLVIIVILAVRVGRR